MRNYRPQIIPFSGPISLYSGRRLADNRGMDATKTAKGKGDPKEPVAVYRGEMGPSGLWRFDCAWCGGEISDAFPNRREEWFCSKNHRDASGRALRRFLRGCNGMEAGT